MPLVTSPDRLDGLLRGAGALLYGSDDYKANNAEDQQYANDQHPGPNIRFSWIIHNNLFLPRWIWRILQIRAPYTNLWYFIIALNTA
jgi:hypothetical protein